MGPLLISVEALTPLRKRPTGPIPYSVPRRFGVGTIMVVTAAFAGMLTILRWLGTPPLVVGFCVVFISLVGVGQAVLFRGRQPRKASLICGAVCLPLMTLATVIPAIRSPGNYGAPNDVCCGLVAAVIFGSGCGYVAGGLAAGVFLVMDSIEKSLASRFPRARSESGEAEGTSAADIVVPEVVPQRRPFSGQVTWKPLARKWVERRFGAAMPELFNKWIVEHLDADGKIDELRESSQEWTSHRFHYALRFRFAARAVDVAMSLRDDDPNDLLVHVVDVHESR
jgi:hypothetical protein